MMNRRTAGLFVLRAIGACGDNKPATFPDVDAGTVDAASADASNVAAASSPDATVGAPVDDERECTDDGCFMNAPTPTPRSAGTACGMGGASTGHGNGACVGCIDTLSCTGGNVCDPITPTCVPPT